MKNASLKVKNASLTSVYEIYDKAGIPTFIEFGGTLDQLINKIGSSEWLVGYTMPGREPSAIHVAKGENVSHIDQSRGQRDKTTVIE